MAQKVYTIMEECADYFYGWSHTHFFSSESLRDEVLEKLAKINLGITYDKGEVELDVDPTLDENKEVSNG